MSRHGAMRSAVRLGPGLLAVAVGATSCAPREPAESPGAAGAAGLPRGDATEHHAAHEAALAGATATGEGLPPGDEPWLPGRFMTQAVALVTRAAQSIEAQTSLGFDGDSACVLGAFLDRGGRIELTRTFASGTRYAILGGGAEGTRDLDLALRGPNGALVASDTRDDATPVLDFTAPSTGRYHVVLSLPEASVSGTFAALAIMRDAGFEVPAGNIGKSFGSTLGTAARASALVAQKWPELGGLVFHTRADWSFYGAVLAEGETITYGGLDLDAPATVVLAATDGQSSNIDLAVVESASGQPVAIDADPDATPLVIFAPSKGRSYEVRITNVASGGPSLVTTLILDAE